MIIQEVIKGVRAGKDGVNDLGVSRILATGILCNWWRSVVQLPAAEIPTKLTDRNLHWYQNHYDDLDPTQKNQKFSTHTPFISTTAGTVGRDSFLMTNLMTPAWQIALEFATDSYDKDGYLFYCYLWIIGRKAVRHQAFSEELRELNVYHEYSPFHPEGEITAKVIIPPAQIQRVEYWSSSSIQSALQEGRVPQCEKSRTLKNKLFIPPGKYSNVRKVLT